MVQILKKEEKADPAESRFRDDRPGYEQYLQALLPPAAVEIHYFLLLKKEFAGKLNQ